MLSAIHISRKSDALITFLEIGPGLIKIAGCNINTGVSFCFGFLDWLKKFTKIARVDLALL